MGFQFRPGGELTTEFDGGFTREHVLAERAKAEMPRQEQPVEIRVKQGRFVEWREHAICRQLPPELAMKWFFADQSSAQAYGYAAAKTVCRQCPVEEECLEDALADPLASKGFRGGKTGRERDALKKRRNRGL